MGDMLGQINSSETAPGDFAARVDELVSLYLPFEELSTVPDDVLTQMGEMMKELYEEDPQKFMSDEHITEILRRAPYEARGLLIRPLVPEDRGRVLAAIIEGAVEVGAVLLTEYPEPEPA